MSNAGSDQKLLEMNAFFRGLIWPLTGWLCMMSVMRFALWFVQSSVFASNVTEEQLYQAFFIGARFDLLVLGFLLIPVVAIGEAAAVASYWSVKIEKALRAALSMLWTLVIAFSYFDFLFFHQFHRRWTFFDCRLSGFEFAWEGLRSMGLVMAFAITALFLFMWILGSKFVEAFSVRQPKPQKIQIWHKALLILWPLLGVALMARGTVTPHHLERKHSLISSFTPLNELAVNSPWSFDKQDIP